MRRLDAAGRPALLLAAHGTRDPDGPRLLDRLGAEIARAGAVDVRLGYVDVIEPTVGAALAGIETPVVVVPAFLAAGYHVRTDLPLQVARSGRDDVVIAESLGPDPGLVESVLDRLAAAGWRAGDAVVLAAAGSSDRRALADVETARAAVAARVEGPVTVGYAATARPTVPEAVRAARAAGAARVAVASWLLAPGLFQQGLAVAGADAVAAPLGVHPAVVSALLDRYLATSSRPS